MDMDENLETAAVGEVADVDDAFQGDLGNGNFSKPRKIRTNSYHRAISTPAKLTRRLPSLSESEDPPSVGDAVLYQQVKERGITIVDDEDDDVIVTLRDDKNCLKRKGALRQSWSNLPSVQGSGALNNMSTKERKRQEAMFELITSEASYLRSLNVLINNFMTSEELSSSVTKTEFHHLFSNVTNVRAASRKFYHALTKRRKAFSVSLHDVCDIVLEHVTSGDFEPYVTYCSNESYQQRALQTLMDNNPTFLKVLRKLESGDECAGLPLHSFLLLPMQRITRLPLLVDTIFQRCDVTMPQYDTASRALRETTNLVKFCNERAKSLERTEEMIQLQQQLDFKSTRSFALISPSRFLVKRGILLRVQEDIVLGFKRNLKQEVCLFLFDDVLLIAKKKSDDAYIVTDYWNKERLRCRDVINDDLGFLLVVEQTQDSKRSEMRFEADKPSTKARWMAVLRHRNTPPYTISNENPQVEVTSSFRATETDMISLKTLDVYIVLEATSDGWYFGERISDGCRGWFPSTNVKEILNTKTRDRNLQRRFRMLGEVTTLV